MRIEFEKRESQNLFGLLLGDLIANNVKKLNIRELGLNKPVRVNIRAERMAVSLIVSDDLIRISNNLNNISDIDISSTVGALLKANNIVLAIFYIILRKLKIRGNLLKLVKIQKLFFA